MANLGVAHLIKGSRALEDSRGLLWIEPYLVENVSGRFALLDALFAGGLPLYGDPGPYPGMFVIQRQPKPYLDSRTQVLVEIIFGPPDVDLAINTIVEFHGTTKEVETTKDSNGNPIYVNYKDYSGSLPVTLPTQIGRVRATKAMGLLTFDFQTDSDPSALELFLNKISSAPWRGRAAYTWKCVDCTIAKVFYRSGWRVRMAFEYDEETHLKTAYYRILGGIIPKDIDAPVDPLVPFANGWTNRATEPLADFNVLALPTTYG